MAKKKLFFFGTRLLFGLKYQFFASNLLNYHWSSPISEFLNSVFQNGSFGTHVVEFFFSLAFLN